MREISRIHLCIHRDVVTHVSAESKISEIKKKPLQHEAVVEDPGSPPPHFVDLVRISRPLYPALRANLLSLVVAHFLEKPTVVQFPATAVALNISDSPCRVWSAAIRSSSAPLPSKEIP